MRQCLKTGLLIIALARPLAAQNPLPPVLSRCQFDRISCEYSGVINVTNQEGAKEVIAASVVRGVVQCIVVYTDENGTRRANGPGLIEISLGLTPDPDDVLPAGANASSKLYTVRVACPSAASDGGEASWSHSYDTYKRPGGEVGVDSRGQATLPSLLEGSYNAMYDGGSGSVQMSWRLCRNCPPPPPPSPPPPLNPPALRQRQ